MLNLKATLFVRAEDEALRNLFCPEDANGELVFRATPGGKSWKSVGDFNDDAAVGIALALVLAAVGAVVWTNLKVPMGFTGLFRPDVVTASVGTGET